jgi:hypothetical protein
MLLEVPDLRDWTDWPPELVLAIGIASSEPLPENVVCKGSLLGCMSFGGAHCFCMREFGGVSHTLLRAALMLTLYAEGEERGNGSTFIVLGRAVLVPLTV